MIRIWISDPGSLGSYHIKGTDESTTGKGSLVDLIYHDPSDLGSLILIHNVLEEHDLSSRPPLSTVHLYRSVSFYILHRKNILSFSHPMWCTTNTLLEENVWSFCRGLSKIVIRALLSTPKARFRGRTFHEPNLIHWIKYMKSSASESIRNACFNLERLSRSFRLAWPRISPLERLWNSFDSDAELFTYRT